MFRFPYLLAMVTVAAVGWVTMSAVVGHFNPPHAACLARPWLDMTSPC